MTTSLEIEKTVCPQCFAVLEAGDSFCRHCGGSLGAEEAASRQFTQVAAKEPPAPRGMMESRWVVLAMLFLVLGPLALPLLWRSREFTTRWKAMLTAIVVGITAGALWKISHDLNQALKPLQELHKLQGF